MTLAHTMFACAATLMLVAGSGPVPVMAQSEAETDVQIEIPEPPEQDAESEVVAGATLYQRLGGYDAIAEMVDDFFERMGKDERLQRFFIGQSESSMRRIRQHTVDFLCERTGGPCFYTGREMAGVHEGTGITEADWARATELMAETMDANGLMGELRDEVGGFIASLKDDIVDEE